MNCCKILKRLRSNPLVPNYRAYSIACNSALDRSQEHFYPVQKCIYNQPSFIYHKRNISIDGVVKWQEQTYNSIANSTLVNYMQDGLLYFHDTTGLTWSVTIITSTVLIRALMTLPLTIYQNYILAKVENIGLELKDMVNEMKKETAVARKMFNLNEKQTILLFKRSMKKQWRNLIERDNCHPLKATIVVWFQIPIWVCISFALRNLVNMQRPDPSALVTFMELEVGGFGWIPNLTEADHSLILPVMFGLTNLAIIEIQRMSKLREPSRMYNIFTNGFRVFSIVMIPIAASVPSCMCLYWTTSSFFGLLQNLGLLSPPLRRKLKIPEAPSELEDPYGHMKEEIKLTIRKTPIIASIYTSGRNEQNFSEPDMFLPFRWDRNDPRRESIVNHTPSASLPFAMGARSCIGKKIAQLQLTELVRQVTTNFDIKCKNYKDVKCMTSQVLVPDRKLQFVVTVRRDTVDGS